MTVWVRKLAICAVLLVLAGLLTACNLSRRTPAPAVQPTATFVAPLTLPTQDPLLPVNPLDATAIPAVVNPNCPATPPTWVAYTVEPGDSLGLLAQQTSTNMSELVAANCLDNPDQIEVGQVLYLPVSPVVAP